MSRLTVNQPHSLTLEEARLRVETLVNELGSEHLNRLEWRGDEIDFEAHGAQGVISVGPDSVSVTAELPMVLRLLRGRIETELRALLRERLA